MIYPILKINQNNYAVELIDSDFDDVDPVLHIKSKYEDSLNLFQILLQALINQYHIGFDNGYDIGYVDGMTDTQIN